MTCSKVGSPTAAHYGLSCTEAVAATPDIARYVKAIEETIFTMSCPYPRCGIAVVDWSDCCAVWCRNTANGIQQHLFCGICTGQSFTDSVTCHSHVKQCEYNPSKGSYFVYEGLPAAHNAVRKVRLERYFKTEIPEKLKAAVVRRIARSAQNLGLNLNFLQVVDEDEVQMYLDEFRRDVLMNRCKRPTCKGNLCCQFELMPGLTCTSPQCDRYSCPYCFEVLGQTNVGVLRHLPWCTKNPDGGSTEVSASSFMRAHAPRLTECFNNYWRYCVPAGLQAAVKNELRAELLSVHGVAV